METTGVVTIPSTTSPPATPAATVPNTPPTTAGPVLPAELEGFPIGTVVLDGQDWTVAVADTAERRGQGLRGVGDLGALDGMLFIMERERTATFDMGSVPIALDIAFFGPDGAIVDRFTMVPCETGECVGYTPAGAFLYAVEAEAGRLGFLTDESVLDLAPLVLDS